MHLILIGVPIPIVTVSVGIRHDFYAYLALFIHVNGGIPSLTLAQVNTCVHVQNRMGGGGNVAEKECYSNKETLRITNNL